MPNWTRPFHLVCEGDGDDSFVAKLASHYQLPAIDISCPKVSRRDHLRGLRMDVDRGVIRRLAVVADNDDHPANSFAKVRRDIQEAGGWPIPTVPQQSTGGGHLAVTVIMLPTPNVNGALETLLLESARLAKPDLDPHVEQFITSANITGWAPQKKDKARLRAFIAATVSEDPNTSLKWIWSRDERPLDISAQAFRPLADFLRAFFS